MNEVMHEYWGRENDRKSVVRLTEKGFEVDLLVGENVLETRKLHDHSESYAESCAENFVDEIFDVEDPNPNSVGYYGFNEKTDNYYPEIDD